MSDDRADAAAEARARARELVRALAGERQQAVAALQKARADLRAVVLAAVEGLEGLAGVVEAFAAELPGEAASALGTATRGLWEGLEGAGLARDGTVGETLDVTRHKVVKKRAAPGAAPDTIVQVLGPGLVFGGERLREAVVVVAKAERGDAAHRD